MANTASLLQIVNITISFRLRMKNHLSSTKCTVKLEFHNLMLAELVQLGDQNN